MDITVREATAEDYDALLLVFDQGDAYHRRALPHIFRKPDGPSRSRAYIDELLSDENATILVAECEGQIVGEVNIAIRQARDIPILVPRRYAAVDTLIVVEAFRRAGVGQSLMEHAHRWALDKGVAEVELSVWDFNDGAIAFYGHLGYKPTRHTMSISLKGQRKS